MRFSEAWLREWVNPAISSEELAEQLTLLGLEVDSVEPAAGDFSGVCVAKLEKVERHPDAEKLSLCTVSDGDASYQVVCGAPNVYTGMYVPFARVGAKLPGGVKIRKAKLRGVESQGMLCSGKELGLTEDSDGILELSATDALGKDFRDYLQLDDRLIEIDLTPDRGDCLSVRGVARDISAKNDVSMQAFQIPEVPALSDRTFSIKLSCPQGCPKYMGRVIEGIDVSAKTPQWMVEKLRRSGIRAISPTVDVTNYVLMELGQPMHAFDLDTLQGGINVRMSKQGETLTILDGSEQILDDDTLLITDQSGPVAMGGIMGGLDTGVSESTRSIFLECAFFNPLNIIGRARRYGLVTDAAYRFERGVDPARQREAMERATQLLIDIVGGKPGPITEAVENSQLEKMPTITLRASRIERLIGQPLAAGEVTKILLRLGMEVQQTSAAEWQVVPPSWRFDVRMEADLIEELARVYGYENIKRKHTAMEPRITTRENQADGDRIRQLLVDLDYQEAITYSFVDKDLQQLLNPDYNLIGLANPISSDLAVMRTSLWPGLLTALERNLYRQQPRVRLFEVGMVFVPDDQNDLLQETRLGGVICGALRTEQWGETARRDVDFFDIKGDLEAVLKLTDASKAQFGAHPHPALHPGQSAAITLSNEQVGWIGRLHPQIEKALDLPQSALLFEVSLEKVNRKPKAKFREISRFPSIRRDYSLVVNNEVTAQQIISTAKAAAPESLIEVTLFDIYRDSELGSGRKSVALGLILQELSRTLTENEVDEIAGEILASLRQNLGATLRES